MKSRTSCIYFVEIKLSKLIKPLKLLDVILVLIMLSDNNKTGLTKRSTTSTSTSTTSDVEDNNLTTVLSSQLKDVGNKSNDHYKSRLSPLRYKLRCLCLPIVRLETEVLANIQSRIRNPVLDFYFAWTANLASHTFYVLMLPAPIWFGASTLFRDLIYVLGLGIYFSGNLKDYLCLPRPRSPPLHRITMSSYTTQEYGFPSSHSANATAVTLVLLGKLFEFLENFSKTTKIGVVIFLVTYYFSLIFGRLYCGMHGFCDVLMGSVIGISLFLFRYFYGVQWDNFLLASHNDSAIGLILTPIFIVSFFALLIHFHVEPVDDCPCFDDTVAFVGVMIGIDLSYWIANVTQYVTNKNPYLDPIVVNFDYEQFGLTKTILRVVMGITLVVIWKAISKPLIFTILPPTYKFIGVYLPRRNYQATAFSTKTTRQIRSQSLSNMKNDQSVGDLNTFIKGVTDHKKRDEQGPENEIDYYEMLDYESKHGKDSGKTVNPKISGVFKPRYDVEIIGRLIIYAGVGTTAFWGFILGSEFFGLN